MNREGNIAVGPGAEATSWTKPLLKFQERLDSWANVGLGAFMSTWVYRVFVSSALSFVGHIEPDPPHLQDQFPKAIRRLLLGPGSWISESGVTYLQIFVSLSDGDATFTILISGSQHARVVYGCHGLCSSRQTVWLEHVQQLCFYVRHFGSWH